LTKKNRALEFVVSCLNEMESDGYQTWEEDGQVPDGLAPDEFSWDSDTLQIVFGNEVWEAKFRKVRPK
jgi:hypothetical protein